MPTASGIAGREYTIILTASGTGTVATTGGETINGASTYSLTSQYTYVTVKSDGSNWLITNKSASVGGSGTVTSVAMTVPTGLQVSGSPITSSGTFSITLQSGYNFLTNTQKAQYDAAYLSSTKKDYFNNGTGGAPILKIVDDSTTTVRNINFRSSSEVVADTSASNDNKIDITYTLGNNSVALGKMATIGANTILGNNTGSTATPSALSTTNVMTMLGMSYQSLANPTGTFTHNATAGSRNGITFTTTGARTLAFSNIYTGYLCTFYIDNTSGSTVALTLPSNGYVQNTSGIYVSTASVTVPTGKSTISLVLYDGSNYWYTTSF